MSHNRRLDWSNFWFATTIDQTTLSSNCFQRSGIPIDKANFVTLLKEIKARLETRGKLLSVAVGAAEALTDIAYDVKNIADTVDFVLLMSYDYQQENVTTYMAPMTKVAGDINSGSVVRKIASPLQFIFYQFSFIIDSFSL